MPACWSRTNNSRAAVAALEPILPLFVNLFASATRYCGPMSDSLERLHAAVVAAKSADPASSRTARLLRAGRAKMAKKLAEEAVEVIIDAMHGSREAVVRESADLLYNLVVLRVSSGALPKELG